MVGGHARVDGPISAPVAFSNVQRAAGALLPLAATVESYTAVRFPDTTSGPAAPTAAFATAYGSGATYCNVAGWSVAGTGLQTTQRCYTPAGVLVAANHIASVVKAAFPTP